MSPPTSASLPSGGRICKNCDTFRDEARRRTGEVERYCSACRWEVDESEIPSSPEYSDLCGICRDLTETGPEGFWREDRQRCKGRRREAGFLSRQTSNHSIYTQYFSRSRSQVSLSQSNEEKSIVFDQRSSLSKNPFLPPSTSYSSIDPQSCENSGSQASLTLLNGKASFTCEQQKPRSRGCILCRLRNLWGGTKPSQKASL